VGGWREWEPPLFSPKRGDPAARCGQPVYLYPVV